MSTRARKWTGFKKRKDYPLLELIELPKDWDDIVVWRPATSLDWDKYKDEGITQCAFYTELNGRRRKVSLHCPDDDGDTFLVDDDDFPFIAWLPMPTINDVLADSSDFSVKKWWIKDEIN